MQQRNFLLPTHLKEAEESKTLCSLNNLSDGGFKLVTGLGFNVQLLIDGVESRW